MASGKPICANVRMSYCPINQFKLGIAREFASPSEYADAIKYIYELDQDSYNEMCRSARETAKYYDYKVLTNKFVNALNN
jgi:glycosyltransferase involved in cell wall biosynthesis